jgi:hypothetical protein
LTCLRSARLCRWTRVDGRTGYDITGSPDIHIHSTCHFTMIDADSYGRTSAAVVMVAERTLLTDRASIIRSLGTIKPVYWPRLTLFCSCSREHLCATE